MIPRMDLDLDIDSLLGTAPAATEVECLGALGRADLEALDRPIPYEDYQVKKLTERHHALARNIASGMKDLEAAALVGYTPQMVVILRKSPAFVELVELYRAEVDTEFGELNAQFAGLTKDAILELRTRLEDEPEKFSRKELLEVVTRMGDRAGFAPVQQVVQNVNFSLSEKLRLARSRVEAAMIDVTPESASGT